MCGSWDPEIWSATFFCHSGPFLALLPHYRPRKSKFPKNGKSTWRYYHFTNINASHMIYGSSDMECNRQNFLSFWTIFCLFTPKNQNFEKMKKLPGDIITLHRCNINDNHMMYGSWNTKCIRQNFLSLWTIFFFYSPHPLTTQKRYRVYDI